MHYPLAWASRRAGGGIEWESDFLVSETNVQTCFAPNPLFHRPENFGVVVRMAPKTSGKGAEVAKKATKRKADALVDDGELHRSIGTRSGACYVWGEGDCGQLGVGPELTGRYRPTPISKLEGIPLLQVACGGMHTCVVTAKHELYTWGVNDEGALGRESDDDGTTVPGLVQGLPA
ncbi:hypothetical protein CYMTET_8983, partial [Cymbomonas tetramitiformis]